MLKNLTELFELEQQKDKAFGAFNIYNYETIKGVLAAAEEKKTGVILAFGAKYLTNIDFSTVVAITKSLAETINYPVVLHLDHCTDFSLIKRAIEAGFTSVMYDGSMLTYEENVANTKKVVDLAKAKNVSVEGELGSLAAGQGSHEGLPEDLEVYTNPEQAKEFVERTGVDCLAVSIGTVHGMYAREPNIRLDILAAINELVTVPLVLHGGSGTPVEKIQGAIKKGIAKINVNTELSTYTIEATKAYLAKEKSPHLSQVYLAQQNDIKDVVKKYISIFQD